MLYQKFVPEGWNKELSTFDKEDIEKIKHNQNDKIYQGLAKSIDEYGNLHVIFGKDEIGIIPLNKLEAICTNEDGIPKSSIAYNKINKFVEFKISAIDEENNYILSRKDVQEDAIKWIKNDICIGDVLDGIITNIKPYGVFVEIGGGVSGLLHIEDISVSRIKNPNERFCLGEKIQVKVKNIDKISGKLFLTYKELLGNWEDNIKTIKEGSIYAGIAKEMEKNKQGIFIELKPNLVGMAEYTENIHYGDKINVYVKKIDRQKKKIKLIIK